MTTSSDSSPKARSVRKSLIGASPDGRHFVLSEEENFPPIDTNLPMLPRPSTSQSQPEPSPTETLSTSTSRALERHHPEGRFAPGGEYFSPRFTIPVTRELHDRIHVALRAAGLEFPKRPGPYTEYLFDRLKLQLEILADQ